MIKAGDMFKNIESGKMFTVKSVDPRTIILGTKDGFHSMFVNPNNMESVFLPFVEDEVKEKLKVSRIEVRNSPPLFQNLKRKGNLCSILTPYARIVRKNSN